MIGMLGWIAGRQWQVDRPSRRAHYVGSTVFLCGVFLYALGASAAGVEDGKIVFHSNRDGNYEIYVMNADGTEVARLTNDGATDISPRFNRDGTKIVFVSNRDGNYEIYVMNADGTQTIRLTRNPASDVNPSFSPDGEKIVFESQRDGNSEIYVMSFDGARTTRLTNNPVNDGWPIFSPDGGKIAFVSERAVDQPELLAGSKRPEEIYSMHVDGAAQTRLTFNQSPIWGACSFSPDGTKIAFSSTPGTVYQINRQTPKDVNQDLYNYDIYVVNIRDSSRKRLTYNITIDPATNYINDMRSLDLDPAFSPDGAKIVWSSARSGFGQLCVMNADGTGAPRQLTHTDNQRAANEFPYWAPQTPVSSSQASDTQEAPPDSGRDSPASR